MTPDEECSAWEISETAKRTFNPIRHIVDRLKASQSTKPFISLGLGDPTVLPIPPAAKQALRDALESDQANGYPPAVGLYEARQALAQEYSHAGRDPLTAEDVFIASGCSGALELIFGTLPTGGKILLPRPGFSFYAVLARNKGLEIEWYDLDAEQGWQIDLVSLEAKLKQRSFCAWLINNPSNPCGSVFSREHLQACLSLAQRYKLLIIADEIYERMTFAANAFHPLASLEPKVPLLVVSAISKRWLVPGWRLGWILVYDRPPALTALRQALTPMAGVILGANSLVQAALPRILADDSHLGPIMQHLARNAQICCEMLSKHPKLRPIIPQGTMYLMVKLEGLADDVVYCEGLMRHQNVLCLPGTIFEMPGYFRIVFVAPAEQVTEACQRILEYTDTI